MVGERRAGAFGQDETRQKKVLLKPVQKGQCRYRERFVSDIGVVGGNYCSIGLPLINVIAKRWETRVVCCWGSYSQRMIGNIGMEIGAAKQ